MKPIYLLPGFWLILMILEGARWAISWGFDKQWFIATLILYIVTDRFDWLENKREREEYVKKFRSYFSNN